jgi:hypothetical protein
MKQIFDKYQVANLRFNGQKSQVCCPRVQYLGYQFDETGVRISDARAQIIKDWPTPKNVKQVRSFLGSINFVKRLVPRHAELTCPLRELLRPNVEFKWGPEQHKSFDLIKQTLSSDTVLAYPRFDNLKDCPFVVICDGSKRSVGSALGQIQPDGSTRIIEYRARPISERESLGSATALELVSLIQAIRWHEPFLRLAPFVIKVDHVTLTYLRELKHSKNPKLFRYALLLSEFDYKIEYTKGRTHTLADSLSRRPFTQAKRDQVEKSQQEVDPLFLSAISEELFEDMIPSDDQIWKSHSRHYRRHAKIMHLAPITLQQNVPPSAPNLDAAQPQQQQPLSSTDDNSDTAPFPTVDDIVNAAENLAPISLQTQRSNEYFAKIIDFLDLQLLPKDRQQARRTILIAEHFQIVNNQLVKNAHFQRKRRAQYRPIVTQICAPKEWRLPTLAQFHDFLNHSNSERCYYTIRDRFFWPNQFADVNNYVLSCEVCQKVRYRRQKDIPSGPSLVFSVMEAVHVDFFGPISPRDGQYSFVLTLCDHSSQFLELCATKSTNATETARCIYEKYYMRHGFVPNIISDRAQSFLANLTQEVFKICKIRSNKTSGFHPHMNGIAKIQNKSLIIALRTHLMQQRTDWTRQIPSVQFAHNISVLPSLSVSPFVIIYNREPRLPIDAQTLKAVRESTVPGFAQNFLTDFDILHRSLAQTQAENREIARQHQFARARQHNLKPGMLVYKFDPTHLTKVSPKLSLKCSGPFRVKYLVGNNVARLEHVYTGREFPNLVNISHLKAAHERRQLLRHLRPQMQQSTSPASDSVLTPSQGDPIAQPLHGERAR